MYTNHEDIIGGFRKNFLAGFGNNLLLFVAAGLLHFIVFILPVISFIYSILLTDLVIFSISVVLIIWPWIHRLYIDHVNNWNLKFIVGHQLGVGWFQVLSLIVLLDKLLNRKVSWKGRDLS